MTNSQDFPNEFLLFVKLKCQQIHTNYQNVSQFLSKYLSEKFFWRSTWWHFFLAINKIRPYEESEVLKMKTCRKAVTFRRKGRPSEDSEQADYYLDVPWNLVPFSSSLAKSGHWKRQTGNRMWGPVLVWLFDLRKVAISLCTFFVPYVDQII